MTSAHHPQDLPSQDQSLGDAADTNTDTGTDNMDIRPKEQAEETGDALPDETAGRIAALEAQLAESNDRLLRALAETENTRKRLEKERQDTAKFAISGFARDLLSVADNLRRALEAIPPEQRESSVEMNAIYTGVEATERVLLQLFEKHGIRRLDPLGTVFDPNLHEVMFESALPGQTAGTVIQVLEPGYTLNDRLLRPARVGVAKEGSGDAHHLDTEA